MYYQPEGVVFAWTVTAYAGYNIPSAYDSMIGKLVTYGKRPPGGNGQDEPGVERIHDSPASKPPSHFQQAILQDPNFRRGVYSTTFIEQLLSGARRELVGRKGVKRLLVGALRLVFPVLWPRSAALGSAPRLFIGCSFAFWNKSLTTLKR
jgi:acetyl/propionyl-CoA carboxylase alpha subunit